MDYLIKGLMVTLILLALATFSFALYSFIYNIKFYFYLKNSRYEKWRELTTIWGFGPGGSNPFKWFPYLYSNEDNDDEAILRYKDNVKFGLRHCFFIVLALIVNGLILTQLN